MKLKIKEISKNYISYSTIQQYIFAELITTLLKNKQIPKNILDLGCGPGQNTALLKTIYPSAKITGVDQNKTFINNAKTNYPWIQFIHNNIETHPFKENQDLIISNATLQWIEKPTKILKKVNSGLNKNGLFIASIFGPKTYHELNTILKKEENIQVTANQFQKKEFWLTNLKKEFSNTSLKELIIHTPYPSLLNLLQTIKHTITNQNSNQKKIWSPSKIKKLEAKYKKEFTLISATHQIWIIMGQKKND